MSPAARAGIAPLDRRWILEHIPHQGAMCLLDVVLVWNETMIRCSSTTHRSPTNPLRAAGHLGAACGIEYAAQAMAVHGALIACSRGTRAPEGYLASVRNVQLHVDRLDDLREALIATATRAHGDEDTAIYDFSLSTAASAAGDGAAEEASAERLLLSGRAAIAFRRHA